MYLGVDIGTTSTKCLAVSEDGRQVAFAQRGYCLQHPKTGWAEQDPEDYWNALVETVRDCVSQLQNSGGRADKVEALAISSQGDTLLALDPEGNPLASALSWMDTRAGEECGQLMALRDERFWYRQLGIRLTPASSACKIRWLHRHQPALFSSATLCYIPEFLAKRLTGQFAADQPSASWNPLYNAHQKDYSTEVLDILHLSGKPLARVTPSGEPVGLILPDVAKLLGLSPHVRLIAGGFDQATAAYGAGGGALLSCGTAWVLYAVSSKPVNDPASGIPFCLHCQPHSWGMVLPFPGGAVFDWVRSAFPEALECVGEQQIYSCTRPLTFIPHFYGALAPDWQAHSRGSLVGLDLSATPGDILAAAMVGIACEARRNLEAAEKFSGQIPELRMAGGATRNTIWVQAVADILQKPVHTGSISESAAYGAARLAAGGVSARWKTAGEENVFLPQPKVSGWASDKYAMYLQTYNALLPVLENALRMKGSSN